MIQIATSTGIVLDWLLQAIVVENTLNRLATAQLIIFDGTLLEEEFGAADDPALAVGQSITIQVNGSHGLEKLFTGIIVKQNLRCSAEMGTLLCLELKHAAVKMSHARRSKVFVDKDENTIFQDLVKRSKISMNSISTGTHSVEKSIQYNVSDWDFLIMRAEANGLLIAANGEKLEIFSPRIEKSTSLKFRLGQDILELDAAIDARQQYATTQSHTWDFESLKPQDTKTTQNSSVNEQFKAPDRSALSQSQGDDPNQLLQPGDHPKDEMSAWADAQVMRSALGRIRGTVKITGEARVKAGGTIEISGASNAFNGLHFVSAVRHEFSDGSWTTDLELGLDQERYASAFDVNDVPVSGLLAKMPGLQLGKVEQVKDDPRKQHRVKVSFVGLPDKHEGVWARVASLDAGKNHGMFFRPQVGDEVLLGFLNEDPRDVMVLGGLYNGKDHKPPFAVDKDGYNEQGILTAAGIKLKFSEKDDSILLETKKGDKIQVVGKKSGSEGIRMQDQFGNLIEMGRKGITIKSKTALKLEAGSKMDIKTVELNGEAKSTLKMKGNASAEISSSGVTIIKGSLVKIN